MNEAIIDLKTHIRRFLYNNRNASVKRESLPHPSESQKRLQILRKKEDTLIYLLRYHRSPEKRDRDNPSTNEKKKKEKAGGADTDNSGGSGGSHNQAPEKFPYQKGNNCQNHDFVSQAMGTFEQGQTGRADYESGAQESRKQSWDQFNEIRNQAKGMQNTFSDVKKGPREGPGTVGGNQWSDQVNKRTAEMRQ